jgi:hypothetical protein
MTTTYSRHVASDKLFGEISDNIDKFVEVYIGRYGRPKLTNKDLVCNLQNNSDSTIVDSLDKFINYLDKHIYNFVSKEDTDLLNIRDEMLGNLNQAKYLFTLK